MLRKGRWKYLHFAEDNPALLFDIENDPRELSNLADDPDHADIQAGLRQQLFEILDPEAVNRQAFSDQARMIDRLGGMRMPSVPDEPTRPSAKGRS